MKIQLSEHFTYNKLLRFVFPSIVMMIFTSIYGVVDGLFVSNYAGKTAFAAINLIMPFIMALSALGFMVGTGGSAIVAKTLGEGKEKEANRYFWWHRFKCPWNFTCKTGQHRTWRLRRPFRLLYPVWAYYIFIINTVYAAKCISVLFCHGGKTKTWFTRHCSCRCYEYGTGLPKSVLLRKNQMVSFYPEKDLYKWLLGVDDKLIQFHCKHTI